MDFGRAQCLDSPHEQPSASGREAVTESRRRTRRDGAESADRTAPLTDFEILQKRVQDLESRRQPANARILKRSISISAAKRDSVAAPVLLCASKRPGVASELTITLECPAHALHEITPTKFETASRQEKQLWPQERLFVESPTGDALECSKELEAGCRGAAASGRVLSVKGRRDNPCCENPETQPACFFGG